MARCLASSSCTLVPCFLSTTCWRGCLPLVCIFFGKKSGGCDRVDLYLWFPFLSISRHVCFCAGSTLCSQGWWYIQRYSFFLRIALAIFCAYAWILRFHASYEECWNFDGDYIDLLTFRIFPWGQFSISFRFLPLEGSLVSLLPEEEM